MLIMLSYKMPCRVLPTNFYTQLISSLKLSCSNIPLLFPIVEGVCNIVAKVARYL